MAALSDRKFEIVKTLVQSAPDKIVGGLRHALVEAGGGDSVLAGVRRLVEDEARDRQLRNAVFLPIAPLCVGDGKTHERLTFPAPALALVWRGLKAEAPQAVADAAALHAAVRAAMADPAQRAPDPSHAYDALAKAAAEALRGVEAADEGGSPEFRRAAELCDAARYGGAEAFAACLDIAPVVRRTLPKLDEWLVQTGDEVSAPARLAYKDAVAVAEDAGPRFFEMLAGQLNPPWTVLRLISAVMDKPTERYLAQSELGGFAERLLAQIDQALKAIGQMDLTGGQTAAQDAARRMELITQQTFELEISISLNRDSGWGQRILGQKQALAALAEARLKEAEKLVAQALPMQASGFSRARRWAPKLDEPPGPRLVAQAMTLLHFAHAVRPCANYGGFSAMHAKVTETLGQAIDGYVEEVLDHLRTGDVADPAIAQAFLSLAADMAGLVRDEKAAELVRRRAHSAQSSQGGRRPGDDAADDAVVLDA